MRSAVGITQKCPIPTGYLFVGKYSKGYLETLSIGDYGKEINVKADFLGYHRELSGVPNMPCKPLTEKWVVTLSTQYGCVQNCNFCDVPNIKFMGNVTFDDLKQQFYNALSLFPSIGYTERLNLHFARMGEPIFNPAVFEFGRWLYENKKTIQDEAGLRIEVVHPVLTTSLPRRFKQLEERIMEWCEIKNRLFNGQAGLQFSINSTDEEQRTVMFGDRQLHLKDLAAIGERMPAPVGRKYCLNFAYSTDYTVDGEKLASMFDPDKFMAKITPIHNNNACRANGIQTIGGYDSYTPYKKPETSLKDAGFDVLVFVPSMDEENGLVTCGNLLIGGGVLKTKATAANIEGLQTVSSKV